MMKKSKVISFECQKHTRQPTAPNLELALELAVLLRRVRAAQCVRRETHQGW